MSAQLVNQERAQVLDVMGATIQYLTSPDEGEDLPCVMRGTVPPGVVVPLHSHADPETFLVESGRMEGLQITGSTYSWVPVRPGDVFHIPGDTPHAWRNPSPDEPAVSIIVSTTTIARFFRDVAGAGPERFLETAERYGYWNATPEENAEVGIRIG